MHSHKSPGIAPIVWGPLVWHIIFDISKILDNHWNQWTKEEQEHFMRFFSLLKFMLPCKYCRKSFRRFFKDIPPHFPFLTWSYNLKNRVNTKLNRPCYLSKTDFLRRSKVYSSFGSSMEWWDLMFII